MNVSDKPGDDVIWIQDDPVKDAGEEEGKAPVRRSSRQKRPVHRFKDPSEPKPKEIRTARKVDKTSAEYLLSNPRSKLVSMDLRPFFTPAVFAQLSAEQRAKCIAALPEVDLQYSESGEASISPDFYSSTFLKEAVRLLQENLEAGRFTPAFRKQAEMARKKRENGDFDKWKDEQFELYWGQNMDPPSQGGKRSDITLGDLVVRGAVQSGDVWVYARAFLDGNYPVEKQVQVADTSRATSLVFLYPETTLQPLPSLGEACLPSGWKYLRSITSPYDLQRQILENDDGMSGIEYHPENPWLFFTVLRGGRPIGSLMDVRMAAYEKEG